MDVFRNGGYVFNAAFGALEHHKPLGGVFAHAIGARAFAIEQLCLALGGGGVGQRLKDGLAQRGQQGGSGLVNLVAVGLQRRGGVGLRAGVAILQAVAPGLGGLCNGKPLQKQRAVPEVFVLVVLHQPIAHVARLADVGARHFDHAKNTLGDIGHAHAARVTGGEEDLNGFLGEDICGY
ncbi:hypothetical protein [Candidatus Aalborgicola defluviihabitans]|uniref:hypothetical protein n=1 Tax=Candidatus Aalborgicola defluviihabitans TaxID=3386187 RepID=UPI001EBB9CB2|nr:hypothetical protein [Burkholderiales bacterium]